MRDNVLLTSFGGLWSRAFYEDFLKRKDYRVFFADVDPAARAKCFTRDFVNLLLPSDSDYINNLLVRCKENDIRFVIPGADEEALRIMPERKRFEEAGILVAVQDMEMMECFSAKSKMYDFLRTKGISVPFYQRFRTEHEFEAALSSAGYPSRPLLIKPDNGRGGRGIVLLSERVIPNKDQLQMMNRAMFSQTIDGKQEFMVMEYIEGVIYDVDILQYPDGDRLIVSRRRFMNVTKLFSGNVFDRQSDVIKMASRLTESLPMKYLIDYDIILAGDGAVTLLEINSRPSGSTVSYLPFGINLYDVLIRATFYSEKVAVDVPWGQYSYAFFNMVKGRA